MTRPATEPPASRRPPAAAPEVAEALRRPAPDRLRKRPRRAVIGIILDDSLADALEAAEARAARANATVTDRRRVTRARSQLDQATLWFVFQSLGRTAFQALVSEHPAVDGGYLAWDPVTFLPALIEACCVHPRLTADDLDAMFAGDAWSDAEINALATAALSVNTAARVAAAGQRLPVDVAQALDQA